MKKFFTREVKIGLVFAVAIAILFFGLNYLKGINIFTPSNHYFATYQNVGGLVVSNPVMIKGYKVGQVRAIRYDFAAQVPFVVEIAVNEDVKLPKGTIFTLADDGLMGGKIINVQLGKSENMHKSGDTLATAVAGNLFSQLDELMPKINNIVENLDTAVNSLKGMINSPSLKEGVNSLGGTLENLNKIMAQLKAATATLPNTMKKIDNIAVNIDNKISEFDLKKITAELEATIGELNAFAQKLNNKESTLGLLLNDKAVYNNLDETIRSANALLTDLKQNPKRYVHFSVFGKKEKQKK